MDTLISPRRRSFLGSLGAVSLLSACGPTPGPGALPSVAFGGFTMSSVYSVKITGRTISQTLLAAARQAVALALNAVDSAMSTHRPQSELSRFNTRSANSPFALSPNTFSVFALAHQVSAATSGAFDITVGPMVDA